MTKTSIVIATDGRADALTQTLKALQYLEGPPFEVIVVKGPTKDGTDEVVAAWGDAIKVVSNSQRNLSQSRNLGIAQASGDIIAFIDDDGNPEPEWLEQIIAGFDAPQVAGVGGLVLDHTGWTPQYRYASANRLGGADWARQTPADHYNFPYSYTFPYLQGTNSAFRRNLLVDIGGFDEEYEFYLDETDVCCRMVDRGWIIRQLPDAIIHHKFLPSKIRDSNRITRSRFSVLKNKLYFSLINNLDHYPVTTALNDMFEFAEANRQDLRMHCDAGRLPQSDLAAFEADLDRAWKAGLSRGLCGDRRTVNFDELPEPPAFRPFPKLNPEQGRKHYVFASAEYPPERTGGVGRYIHQLAREIARLGHHVRVVTHTDEHPRCDFEDGVWVDRVPIRETLGRPEDLRAIPDRIWNRAATVRDRIDDINQHRPVSVVYAPIWDCEGIAVLKQNAYPLVVGLQTTLQFWLDNQPHMVADANFMSSHGTPMLKVEKDLINQAAGLHFISRPLLGNIMDTYGLAETDKRAHVVPLGLEDWTVLPAKLPDPLPVGSIRILFVGRLERRKGIDILLEVAPALLERHPNLYFDIVGNDQIPSPDGRPYRTIFEDTDLPDEISRRVRFYKEIDDATLRGFYASCDILAGPSRYESFGLMLVEGMIFGKPVVGCAAGGMLEVVEDRVSGILAQPGDPTTLMAALESLVSDAQLRAEIGRNARARYEAKFTSRLMALNADAILRETEANWHAAHRTRRPA